MHKRLIAIAQSMANRVCEWQFSPNAQCYLTGAIPVAAPSTPFPFTNCRTHLVQHVMWTSVEARLSSRTEYMSQAALDRRGGWQER